jgi:hypothetical protein
VGLVSPQFLWSAGAQSLCWRANRQGFGLVSHLFFLSASAQTLWWPADRQGRSCLSCLCSFGLRCFSHCGGGPIAKCVVSASSLFDWSKYSYSLCWRADRQGLSSWSRLCSFGLRGFSHCGGGPIAKCVVLVSPLFLWSICSYSLFWRANRQGHMSGLASFLLVGVSQSLWCGANRQGRWSCSASVPFVGMGSSTNLCRPTTSLHVLNY